MENNQPETKFGALIQNKDSEPTEEEAKILQLTLITYKTTPTPTLRVEGTQKVWCVTMCYENKKENKLNPQGL